MLEGLHNFDLLDDKLLRLVRQIRLKDLQGNFAVVVDVVTKLHLAGTAGSERLENFVFAE